MPGGRPRSQIPDPEECVKLGKELLKWAKEEDKKNPHCRFAQWYSLEKMIPRKVWKTLVQCPQFLPYYEACQAILAGRVMDPKVMDKSFGHRYLRLYDREIVESENEEVAFKAEASKKVQEENFLSPELLAQYVGLMEQLKKSQSAASTESKSINNEK